VLVSKGRALSESSKRCPNFKTPALRFRMAGERRNPRRSGEPPASCTVQRKVPPTSAAWARGRPAPEVKNSDVAASLTHALDLALHGAYLDVHSFQPALRRCWQSAQLELGQGQLQKRDTLRALGECQELLGAISASEQEARRLLRMVRRAEEGLLHKATAGRLWQHLAGLDSCHQQLGCALAAALWTLGIGRSPCCHEGHAMDVVPLQGLATGSQQRVCDTCGRNAADLRIEAGDESMREPWWKCRICCANGLASFYCHDCGRETQNSCSYAQLLALVPTEHWRMTMKRLGRDRAVPPTGPVSKDGVKPASQQGRGHQSHHGPHGHGGHHGHHGRDLAETPPDLRLALAGLAGRPGPGALADSELGHPFQNEPNAQEAHEVHRLGAPSPSSDAGKAVSFAGVFGQEMADGQQSAPCFAATFFTDDIDDASVVSTFSASSNGQLERTPTSMTGETAAKAGFQGLVLSAEHTNIWNPPTQATKPCRSLKALTPGAAARSARDATPPTAQRRHRQDRHDKHHTQILRRRPKLPISPGLENVLLGGLRPVKGVRWKQRTASARRSSQAVEADDIAQELLERAGPRTEKTAPDGYQQRGPYVVAPEEIFDGSMKDMDLPVWQGVVTCWQRRIQAAEREKGLLVPAAPAAPLPQQRKPRLDQAAAPALRPVELIQGFRAWSPSEWSREAARLPWIDPDDILDYYFAR